MAAPEWVLDDIEVVKCGAESGVWAFGAVAVVTAAMVVRTEIVSERALQKAPKPDCAGVALVGLCGGLPLGRSMAQVSSGPWPGGRRSTAALALRSRPRVT